MIYDRYQFSPSGDVPMAYIQVRDFYHYYEWITASGQPQPSGSKPVMVFLHGWGGSARYWETTARSLLPEVDCLLYDLRGFGRSTPGQFGESAAIAAPGYEMEDYALDLATLLDQLGLDQIFLNAHSMGGSIATFFMNQYPDRVKRAILTCNGIFEYDEKAFTAFHKFGGYVVKFRPRWLYGLPGMDRMFMKRFLHRPLSSPISRAFLDDFLMADYDAALGTIYTSVSQRMAEILPLEFSRLSVPTLMVSGDRDIIIPAEMGRRAAGLNPLITFATIPETAHFPMLEDAATYLKLIREFLQLETAHLFSV